MNVSVHIIHPYTYKARGESLVIGNTPEFSERDTKINTIIQEALSSGSLVYHHRDKNPNYSEGLLRDCLFIESQLSFLLDDRLRVFVTMPNGLPLPDEAPPIVLPDVWKNT